jgi:DnaJ-class molecular chaperone
MAAEPDYYARLQVPRNASPDDLKKAYRRLARRYHPDRNPGPEAVAAFQSIQQAWQVLQDPEKRALYDRYGVAGVHGISPSGAGDPTSPAQVVTLFRMAARNAGRALRARRGKDLRLQTDLTFEEAALGCVRYFELPRRSTRDPDGLHPVARRLEFRLPAGVRDGETLRWPGEGAPGTYGAPDGNLLVDVRVRPHPIWHRREEHIVAHLPLWPSEAIAGCRVQVPTLRGLRELTVLAGTAPGSELRIPDAGIQREGAPAGDALFVVQIAVPATLSPRHLALLQQAEAGFDAQRSDARRSWDVLLAELRNR